jgi:YVTN family beta-propeller protein
MIRWWLLSIFLCRLAGLLQASDTLKLAATIPLPQVNGRFDHFAIDNPGRRLFVAALGNNSLEVIDVAANKRITSITGLRKPTGPVFLPQNRIGIAAGGDGAFKVFSGDNYKPIGSVESLDDADNVRFDSSTDTIYIGYGDGALAIVDAKTLKKTGDIKIGGHPESFQVEQKGRQIIVNVPGVKEVAIIDRDKGRIIGSLPMTKFRSNFPMALDETSHRVFVGCRQSPRLVVFDAETRKQLADTEISGDTDDLFYDAKRQRVYISCGAGFIDVVAAAPDQPLRRIQSIATRSGARTSYFSTELDRFYLAVPKNGNDPAEIRIWQPVGP